MSGMGVGLKVTAHSPCLLPSTLDDSWVHMSALSMSLPSTSLLAGLGSLSSGPEPPRAPGFYCQSGDSPASSSMTVLRRSPTCSRRR